MPHSPRMRIKDLRSRIRIVNHILEIENWARTMMSIIAFKCLPDRLFCQGIVIRKLPTTIIFSINPKESRIKGKGIRNLCKTKIHTKGLI